MLHDDRRIRATAGSFHAPWLVSMMWTRFMQFVPEEGIERTRAAAIGANERQKYEHVAYALGKLVGYLVVESDAAARGSKRIDANAVVRPTTAGGRKAPGNWRPRLARRKALARVLRRG